MKPSKLLKLVAALAFALIPLSLGSSALAAPSPAPASMVVHWPDNKGLEIEAPSPTASRIDDLEKRLRYLEMRIIILQLMIDNFPPAVGEIDDPILPASGNGPENK